MPAIVSLNATYRIVTPMFCSGADQNKAELRPASFKGALRFWWRTLQHRLSTEELHAQEAEIFGSSGQEVGQSKVRLRFSKINLESTQAVDTIIEQGKLNGAHYLGYGVMDAFGSKKTGRNAGQLTRPMIPGGTFEVVIRLSPSLSISQIEAIQSSMILLGTIGGLGSKSRKGFGSLCITSLHQNAETISLDPNPATRLRKLFPVLPSPQTSPKLPAWTTWSQAGRIIEINSASSPVKLLDHVGREQVHFRSWGNNNKVLYKDSEKNFPADHDESKNRLGKSHPHRASFGLPHNYGKGQKNAVEPRSKNVNRRASPLFIHIEQPSESAPVTALLAFLPSEFLEPGEAIQSFGNKVPLDRSDAFWYPIHAFLDRLISTGNKPADRPGYENFPSGNTWWERQNATIQGREV